MEDKKMEIWRGAFRGEERNDDQSKREMEARGVGGTQGREQTKRGNSPGGREMERERRRSASGSRRPLRGGQVVTGGAVSDTVQGTGVRESSETKDTAGGPHGDLHLPPRGVSSPLTQSGGGEAEGALLPPGDSLTSPFCVCVHNWQLAWVEGQRQAICAAAPMLTWQLLDTMCAEECGHWADATK
ncbi:hypothetical protein KUCAC02_023485 [Chaenocephalus aceratus]|uniref:Uncharacterized protein n=1 Tax=Chaenocephalus aceratus TaxID=36190 RepID=A0ACB9XQ54_CHAAC|nr:hypothetical protein KUCAC02_023485 [Chaenocephalus aceratus]